MRRVRDRFVSGSDIASVPAALPEAGTSAAQDEGFILPYVLGAIAALAAIASIAASAIQQGQSTTRDFERLFIIRQALDSVEQQAAFIFLTARLVRDGIDLSDGSLSAAGDRRSEPDELGAVPDADLWRYDGEVMEIVLGDPDLRAFVAYQDPEGLLALNTASEAHAEFLLRVLGVGADTAASLAAGLGDYVDADNSRRFRGGERSEYRLSQLDPPTNSPVRTWAELAMVKGWASVVQDRKDMLLDLSTMALGREAPRIPALPEAYRQALTTAANAPRPDPSDIEQSDLASSRTPSQRARFALSVVSIKSRSGLRRVIETERRTSRAGPPFSRLLVDERALTAEEIAGFERDAFARLDMSSPAGSLAGRPAEEADARD
jgi:hypothetical protein